MGVCHPITYTVTFDCEGNTPGGKYDGNSSFTKTMSYLTANNNVVPVPTLEGYVFQGWYTANKKGIKVFDKTGTAITDNAYWNASGQWQYMNDVTFHAQWRPDRDPYHFTISYSANGGINAPVDQDKEEWTDINLSTDEPTKLHYTFEGWNTDPNGSGTGYNPGDLYEEDEDLILYAQWNEIPQVGETLSTRVVFTVGKSKNTAPTGGSSSIGGSEYGSPRNIVGEGYQYELFQSLVPDGGGSEYGATISKVLKTGYKYHTRSLAFRDDGSKYGYHFIDLLGGIGYTDN